MSNKHPLLGGNNRVRFDLERPDPRIHFPDGLRAMSAKNSDGGWVNSGYWRRALPMAE